ncbi:hypothetical protein [Altibacter sp. HG106]|uniref:hypothetical protein n=1 Tax=Altibacter sp. HG106 TaxID=3023937 RepID=UPI0023506773|nr:hypothetical protein [Altibacter sp. HG106]MDC7994677.1 hypothetical protein [Altibacter sp. HG106]
MRSCYVILGCLLIGCGTPQKNPSTSEAEDEKVIISSEPRIEIPEEEPAVPNGAVTATFNPNTASYYAYIKKIDMRRGETTIAFENNNAPPLIIPKTYGASLEVLRFPEFESDLLLVTAQLKDPIFNKYFLYILKEGSWQPVVNGFALHKSHVSDTLVPIMVDPEKPGYMFRYYSVFDLDEESELGYTWRLFNESIPIQNQ